jgi:hypothetical protein
LERTRGKAERGDSDLPGQREGGISMEEHGKLWAIATVLFVIAIIGYVLQA